MNGAEGERELDLARLAAAWEEERAAIATEPILPVVAEFVASVLPGIATRDPATAAGLVGPIKVYIDATTAELRANVAAARAQLEQGTLGTDEGTPSSSSPPGPRAGGYSLEQRLRVLQMANAIRVRRRRSGILARMRAFVVAPSPRRWAGRARAPRSHRPAGGTRCRSPGRPRRDPDDVDPPGRAPRGSRSWGGA